MLFSKNKKFIWLNINEYSVADQILRDATLI
jgi:hypothetical protein